VINDRSTDRTGAILDAIDDPRLIVVQGEEPPPNWLGKPHALHLGSQRARGELLLFVDADVIYAPDAVAAAVTKIEESGAAMLALLPHFELHGFWEHVTITNLVVVAFTMVPLWIANRTRTPLLAVGGGPGNLIRRDAYDAIGGHVSLKDAVVDDIGLARLARSNGLRTEVALANDFVSLRMYHGKDEIVEGFTKNSFAVFGRSYVVTFVMLLAGLVTQILPYVFAAMGDVVAMLAVATMLLTRVILFLPLRYRIDNALFGHVPMVMIWVAITLRSVWYTGVRRQVRWRGRTYRAD
jgi:chlorobactene glucosyltransferase